MISDKQKLIKEKLLEFMDQTGESWFSVAALSGVGDNALYRIRDDKVVKAKTIVRLLDFLENYPRRKDGRYELRL